MKKGKAAPLSRTVSLASIEVRKRKNTKRGESGSSVNVVLEEARLARDNITILEASKKGRLKTS